MKNPFLGDCFNCVFLTVGHVITLIPVDKKAGERLALRPRDVVSEQSREPCGLWVARGCGVVTVTAPRGQDSLILKLFLS